MKWIGWILSVMLLIAYVGLHQIGVTDAANEQKVIDAQIALREEEVERIFATASEGLPELDKRLEQEKAETAALETQQRELSERKAELERRITELENSTERLRNTKDGAQEQRRENMGQITELQEKIDLLEKQNAALADALETVSEKVGL